MTLTIAEIAKNPAWEVIESINWAKNCNKRSTILKKDLVTRYYHSYNKVSNAHEFVSQLVTHLSKAIDKCESEGKECGFYGGGDSFSDMVHHVVGLGLEKYLEILQDPTKLKGMNYVESFAYVWPYNNSELDKLSPDYHSEKAYHCLGYLYRLKKDNWGYLPKESQDIVKELIGRFEQLADGEFEKATKGLQDSKEYSRLYTWKGNPCSAMFANYLKDAYEWLVAE